MRQLDVQVRRESWESASVAGRYNRGLEAIISRKDRSLILPIAAGAGDSVSAFEVDRETIAIVAVNDRLQYCGLETFEASTGATEQDVFLQADYEIRDILGRRGTDLAPRTIARKLLELLDY